MKNKSTLIKIIAYVLCLLITGTVIIVHGSMNITRVILMVGALALGVALLVLMDRWVDRGADVNRLLSVTYKKTTVLVAVAYAAITFFAIYVRYSFLYFESADALSFFVPWTEQFRYMGIKTSLGCNITDYSCMRTTIDVVLANILPFTTLTMIKIVPMVSDFANAILALLLLKEVTGENGNSTEAVILYACMLLNPVSVLNSAAWGQSDAFYTVFVLTGILFILKVAEGEDKKADMAVIMFAVAFACKLQAIFALPILFFYWAMQQRTATNKGIKVSQLVWFPIVYFVTGLPMFLCGRTLGAIFGVYFTETGKYLNQLTLRYYNIYSLIGEKTENNDVSGYVAYGIALAIISLLCVYYVAYRKKIELRKENLLKMTAITVQLLLFLLPCMHERYAFVGEMVIIILACMNTKYIVPAIITILCTSVTYAEYLMGTQAYNYPIPEWIVALGRMFVVIFMIKDIFKSEENKYMA